MRGRELSRVAAAVMMGLAVTGCDTTVQEQLGIGKRAPDEFQVVRRAPLVIPPDSSLRPPAPGTAARGEPDSSTEARGLLTGEEEGSAPVRTASAGEQALLGGSPVQAEPGIRGRIVAENGELTRLDRRTFLYILSFQRGQFAAPDQVLDPAAEAARLRAAQPGGVVTVRTGSSPLPVP